MRRVGGGGGGEAAGEEVGWRRRLRAASLSMLQVV